MIREILLSLPLAAIAAVRAVAVRHKTELVALVVVGLALLFASPFDRYLIAGSVLLSLLLGRKLGTR